MVLGATVAAAAAAQDAIVRQARTETTVVARTRSTAVVRVKSPLQPWVQPVSDMPRTGSTNIGTARSLRKRVGVAVGVGVAAAAGRVSLWPVFQV